MRADFQLHNIGPNSYTFGSVTIVPRGKMMHTFTLTPEVLKILRSHQIEIGLRRPDGSWRYNEAILAGPSMPVASPAEFLAPVRPFGLGELQPRIDQSLVPELKPEVVPVPDPVPAPAPVEEPVPEVVPVPAPVHAQLPVEPAAAAQPAPVAEPEVIVDVVDDEGGTAEAPALVAGEDVETRRKELLATDGNALKSMGKAMGISNTNAFKKPALVEEILKIEFPAQ